MNCLKCENFWRTDIDEEMCCKCELSAKEKESEETE